MFSTLLHVRSFKPHKMCCLPMLSVQIKKKSIWNTHTKKNAQCSSKRGLMHHHNAWYQASHYIQYCFTTQSRLLKTLIKKTLENTVFYTLSQREIIILAKFNLSSANAFNLVMSKNLLFRKELRNHNLHFM